MAAVKAGSAVLGTGLMRTCRAPVQRLPKLFPELLPKLVP
jgi:hypothetical protein